MKKKVYQFLSVLLCVLMVTQCLPMRAIAQGVQSLATEEESAAESVPTLSLPASESEAEEPYIVGEIFEKREADTKHFLMSDRSVLAAKYETRVHYEKNGSWLDIDLSGEESESEIAFPENAFETKFSKKSNGKKLVTMTQEKHTLSWGLDSALKVDAEYSSLDPEESEDPSVLKNLEGRITYPEILANTDLEYIVTGEGIKENIILKNQNAPAEFLFHYETGHLSLRLDENGNLELFDGEEVVFTLEKPVMFDSAKAFSDAVEMTLKETGNGKFTLTLTPDKDWLFSEDRVWPVVVDPSTYSSTIDANIWDINLSSRAPAYAQSHLATDNAVGSNGPSDVWRSLIRVQSFPEIGTGAVLKAEMSLTNYLGEWDEDDSPLRPKPAGPIQVNAHRITASWPEIGATWNGYAANFDPIVEDYFTYYGSEEGFLLDITELVSGWYNGTFPNYGLMLKSANETATGQIMQFTSSDWGYNSNEASRTWRPTLLITYRDTVGVEDYWNYSTNPLGCGTGFVNNFNGNLTWILPISSFTSGVNGFTLSLVYNSAEYNCNHPSVYHENQTTGYSPYGKGWRLNLFQLMYPATQFGNPTESYKYVYVDADGTKHYFVEMADGSIVDEDGLGYTYTYVTGDPMPHRITDKNKTVMMFDNSMYLGKIQDANGNYISLEYVHVNNQWLISAVTTSTGGEIELAYSLQTNQLQRLFDNAGRITSFGYNSSGYLTSISKIGYDNILFGYTGPKAQLDWVRAEDHTSYHYYYDSRDRISISYLKANDGITNRYRKSYAYDYCQTRITEEPNDPQIQIPQEEKYTLTYQFDTWGRVTGIYDSENQTYTQSHTETSTEKDKIFANNKVTLTANSVQYIDNILLNGAFQRGVDSWSYAGAGTSSIPTVDAATTLLGTKSFVLESAAPSTEKIYQNLTVDAAGPGSFTLSGYLKTENVTSSEKGAAIEICYTTSEGNESIYSEFLTGSSDSQVDGGFERVSVTVNLGANERILSVAAGLFDASGKLWVNGLQLEEGDSANHFNLVTNSSFEYDTIGTNEPTLYGSLATDGGVVSSDQPNGNRAFMIPGHAGENRYVSQTLHTSGKAGDVFTFGSWAKADACPSKADEIRGLKITLQAVDENLTSLQQVDLSFNEYINTWQFASKTVVMEKDYDDILLYFCYDKNANTAYVGSTFCYRDTAQSYRYDGNGNVVSTSDYASQQSNFNYNNNNLSKLASPDGTGFEYFYDAKGNLISSHSAEGLVNQFTYDEKGNPISSETFANESSAAIQSGKTYYVQLKSSGQYLTVKDAGTAAGTSVIEAPFTGGDEQRWMFVSSPKGGFVLVPKINTNLALDVISAADEENTAVMVHTQNGGDNQRFYLRPQKNYTYQLVAAHSENGKILTSDRRVMEGTISILTPQGEVNPDQCWIIKEAAAATTLEDGLYHIRARHSGAYLDVPGNTTTVGTALQQHEYNDSKAQIFYIKSDGAGAYLISPVYAPDQYIQYSVNRDADGLELVELGDGTIGIEDPFCFRYNGTGDWSIYCKSFTTFFFSVSRGDTANGAGIVVASGDGYQLNQRFILEKVSPRITSSMTYQNNGNFPESVTDSRGNTTEYAYDFEKGLLTSTTDAEGNTTSYTYNANTDLLTGVSSGGSSVGYTYQNGGYLQSITSPSGTSYSFLYDKFYDNTQIQVGSQALSTNEYDEEGKITKTTYGNGSYVEFVYDDLDRVVEKKFNGVAKVRYRYDKSGKVYESVEPIENSNESIVTRYRYDLSGRLLEAKRSDGSSLRYTYDELNRVSKITTTTPNEVSSSTEYIYGNSSTVQKAGLIYGVKENGTQTLSYSYDELVRLKERTLDATANDFTTEYGYLNLENGDTTTLIETVKNGNDTLLYEYDEVGNITSVSKNGTEIESYTYDSLNQLHTVTRGADTWEYTYDNGGNILSVKKNGVVEKSYTYGNTNWKDLLTAFNGQSITYDAIGNPLQYRGGMAFTWANGRKLATVTKGTDSIGYAYNEAGLRTSKTVNGTTTTYHWLEGVLIGQTCGTDTILFLYDENGTAYGFTLNGTAYYYIFNLQGDVIGILDSNGATVAEYTYDAWGNILSVTGSLADSVGEKNPLRYRGYYYDDETGFYYVSSRYYDSEIGRWINADSVMGITQDMSTYNLFVYCGNNPVCRYDVGGLFWKELISGVLHKANNFAITIGIDTAAIGAFFLMMEPDDSGVYHASFDCWQQYAGYNQFYDFAFNLGTSMVAAQFSFSYDGCGYTIWAWKGDYINLGAGAELGIYRGSSGHRIVDTSLAMWMGMIVSYKNEWIIDYFPNEDQWWITGFNPKYQNVNANDLLVTIGVGFNDFDMYHAFKRHWGGDARWSFYDYMEFAILQF